MNSERLCIPVRSEFSILRRFIFQHVFGTKLTTPLKTKRHF